MVKELNLAFIITAYDMPDQLTRLINCIGKKVDYENIYVHIDKKSGLDIQNLKDQTNSQVSYFSQFNVYWGGFNQLQSILFLIEQAVSKKEIDFVILLSGHDLPVVEFEKLLEFLSKNKNRSFITSQKFPIEELNHKKGLGRVQWYWFMDLAARIRGIHKIHRLSHLVFEKLSIVRHVTKGIEFYGGSDWWILPGKVAKLCLDEFQKNKKIRKCFRYSFIPTEMFFHTIIGNSQFQETVVNNNYRYISWTYNIHGHPNTIKNEDKSAIETSGCLFARKFDLDEYPEIFEYFEKKF
jgi:hypothetical protein